MTLPVPDAQNIPLDVLYRYHQRYNNHTYRAFSDELHTATSTTHGEAFLHATMNLLIDASLCRCGAVLYKGVDDSLMRLLMPISADLVALAQAHLDNFGPMPIPAMPVPADHVREQIRAAQRLAEEATRAASDLPSWRGCVAYKLASGAAYRILTKKQGRIR